VFPPRGFADCRGLRVGVYGVGVEGRATLARLRHVTDTVVAVDDVAGAPDVLATADGGREALLACDLVIKSPGISPLQPTVKALREAGVTVTSALNLWCSEALRDRVIAVTGTKGKSTTTSLITYALHALGETAQSVGNIGRPPYDPELVDEGGWLVLELSSFQSVDLTVAPARIVVTALGSDHLDWHGSLEAYRTDKLSVTRLPQAHRTFVADTPLLREYREATGGEVHYLTPDTSTLTSELGLLGDHSRSNVALAIAVVADATGRTPADVAAAMREQAAQFVPLRGRLTLVRQRGALRFVDDGLATSALPTMAALEVFATEPVALLCGGFDRGVDYQPLAEALARRIHSTTVVAMGPAGARIADVVTATTAVPVTHVEEMREAVAVAVAALPTGGVVLLSPAAPSFDRYANWLARSEDFAATVAALGDDT